MKEKKDNKNILKKSSKAVQRNVIRRGGDKINGSNALLAVVVVLVIMSGVQVFQTQKLLKSVSSGTVKASPQTQSGSVGLPSQVGGCG